MPPANPRFPAFPLTPGVYSQLDASALQPTSPVAGPIVGIVGDCTGGVPNVAHEIKSVGVLKSLARSGPAYDAARAAFLGGASVVKLVRVGTPTKSTGTLAGTTGTPVTLTSLDNGAATAQIKRTVEANNKVTITFTEPTGETVNEVYAMGNTATAAQVADAINGNSPQFPKSRYVSATSTTVAATMPLTAAVQAVLTTPGTDDASIDASDWTNGLAVLETEDVDLLVVATGDATVHAQALAHCNLLSGTAARKERVMPFGGILGETPTQAAARYTGTLLDKRAQLVYPGISLFNDAGTLTSYAPFVAAAYVAGMHAALPDVATSLVGANLGPNVINVERRLSQIPGGDVEVLLAAGVTPIGLDPRGGFQIVDSLSGYRTDFAFRDFHKIRTADYVAKTLRERLEARFKGRKMLGSFASEVETAANQYARDLVVQELIVAAGDAAVTIDSNNGTITYVSVPVVLPDTSKYLLLTVGLTPASAIPTPTT